jgi:hypothetical protein
LFAEETVATRNRERHHHAIADFQVVNFPPDFDNLTHEFVTEYVASLHRGNEPVIEVQVRTANRSRGDLHDGVALVKDLWIRNFLDTCYCLTVPTVRSH